jgi:transposase
MPKRKYRSIPVGQVHPGVLAVCGGGVVVGIDIAKQRQFASFMTPQLDVLCTVRWEHPFETPEFVKLVSHLRDDVGKVDVVMEPSGVYGDAIRHRLGVAGFKVYRVSPKRTHDAAEVYDGVPSLHDAKAAAIIAKLHLDGASTAWPVKPDKERDLVAQLRVVEVHHKQARQGRNRIEALTARHWPEVTHILKLKSATLLELLTAFGSAQAVAASPEDAWALMQRVGRSKLSAHKIEEVIASAVRTVGMPPTAGEVVSIQALAGETRRNQLEMREALKALRELTADHPAVKALAPVVGHKTSATIVAAVGDPREFDSAKALVKAMGLNLRIHSSGKRKPGRLHITKRGHGMVRMMLWLAALRYIKSDPVVRSWFEAKVVRDGGKKPRAIVAVMRKLAMGLWHVARGNAFDSSKLFELSRLRDAAETAYGR